MKKYLVCAAVVLLIALALLPSSAGAKLHVTGLARGSGTFHYDAWGGDSAMRFNLREIDNDPSFGPVSIMYDGEWWTGRMDRYEGNFIDQNSVTVLATVYSPDGSQHMHPAFVCWDNGPGQLDRILIDVPESYDDVTFWLTDGDVVVRDLLNP